MSGIVDDEGIVILSGHIITLFVIMRYYVAIMSCHKHRGHNLDDGSNDYYQIQTSENNRPLHLLSTTSNFRRHALFCIKLGREEYKKT